MINFYTCYDLKETEDLFLQFFSNIGDYMITYKLLNYKINIFKFKGNRILMRFPFSVIKRNYKKIHLIFLRLP